MPATRRNRKPRGQALVSKRKSDDFEDLVPPASDPCWARDSRSLFNYLNRPRTNDQVTAWAYENGHTRSSVWHLLAWLRIQRLIMFDTTTNRWTRPDAFLNGNGAR